MDKGKHIWIVSLFYHCVQKNLKRKRAENALPKIPNPQQGPDLERRQP